MQKKVQVYHCKLKDFLTEKAKLRALFQIVWDLKITLISYGLLATNVNNEAKQNKMDTPKCG